MSCTRPSHTSFWSSFHIFINGISPNMSHEVIVWVVFTIYEVANIATAWSPLAGAKILLGAVNKMCMIIS